MPTVNAGFGIVLSTITEQNCPTKPKEWDRADEDQLWMGQEKTAKRDL